MKIKTAEHLHHRFVVDSVIAGRMSHELFHFIGLDWQASIRS